MGSLVSQFITSLSKTVSLSITDALLNLPLELEYVKMETAISF